MSTFGSFGCFIWITQKSQEGSKKFFVWLRMQSTIYNSSEGGERSTSYPLPLSASSSYLASLMLQLYPNISEFDHLCFMKIPCKYWTVSNSCLNWFSRFKYERHPYSYRPKSYKIQKTPIFVSSTYCTLYLRPTEPIIDNVILGVCRICCDFEIRLLWNALQLQFDPVFTNHNPKNRNTNSYIVYLSVCLTVVVVAKNRRVVVCCQFVQLSLPKSFLLQFVLVLFPFIQLNCWNIK